MGKLTLLFTGDVMLGRNVNTVLRLNNFSWVWGDTLKIFHDVDLRLINLECVISEKGQADPRSYFHFRAKIEAIKVLKKAKIDFVSLANNHVLDYGEEALLEMLELLRKNEIVFAGAGKDIEEASRPSILEKNNLRIAVISLADYPKWWEATKEKPGINYLPLSLDEEYLERVKKSIETARKNANFIIISCHVGPHYRSKPSKDFINFAHTLIDLGADIYWGHSNHIPQGIEIYKNKLIMYDTGDFIDDYAVDQFEYFRNDQSFIFLVNLKNGNIKSLELIPVKINSYEMQVNLAKGEEKKTILKNMKKLCQELGTRSEIKNGKILILP